MAAGDTGPGPAVGMFAADRASRDLGMELLEAGDGRATVRTTVARSMMNGHGIAHGGYVFLLADTAFAFACNSRGVVTVAAGADISSRGFGPARAGDVCWLRSPKNGSCSGAAGSTT